MEIRCKASLSASCLHAVLCREMGFAGVDRKLAEMIAEPAELLCSAIGQNHLPVLPTLSTLGSLTSEYDNNRQLVEIALKRLFGSGAAKEATVTQIAAAVGGLETRLLAARPGMVDELELRCKPLVDQWLARGNGLLKQVARLTAENFLAPASEVVLVTPWVGGFGRADLGTNRVILEAVLADPLDDLPEALRLGWLLSQLGADVPMYGEAISAEGLPRIAGLAVLPVVLSAAETVEWGHCTPHTIQRAIECWQIDVDSPGRVADTLFRWWEAYQTGGSSWEIAWRALEPLLR